MVVSPRRVIQNNRIDNFIHRQENNETLLLRQTNKVFYNNSFNVSLLSLSTTYTQAHTHARTHAHTHTRTHALARTHTHNNNNNKYIHTHTGKAYSDILGK